MFQIEMLPAEYGDCLWIEYGKSESEIHRVLIDGGTINCGDTLRDRIESLEKKDRYFDLVVATHIDSDHIDGIVKLMQNIPDGFECDNFWFNSYEHTVPEGYLGAIQGEYLAVELRALEKKFNRKFWNESFGRKAAMIPDSGNPITIELAGGMQMTILGPTSVELNKLHQEWDHVIEKAHMTPGDLKEALEKLKNDRRFRPGWLGKINVNKLANSYYEEDDSPSNGSSIILLAEYDNKKALFTGDAFPTTISDGLKRLSTYNGRRTSVDAFKVPHHGSKKNTCNELYKAVESSKYMVSTDGQKFGHPDEEGIARILNNNRSDVEIYFNYTHAGNKEWSNNKLQTDYKYSAIYSANGYSIIDLTH